MKTIKLFDIPLVVSSVPKFADFLIEKITQVNASLPTSPLAVMVVSMQDIMARRSRPATARAFAAFDYYTMDGVPLVWLARCVGYTADRIYGPDLFAAIMEKTN